MNDGVTYIIYEDDPDAPLGRREVTRSAAPAPAFTLPARTYYVTARSSGAEAREQIAIGAGDVVKRSLPLALAHLSLSATLGGAPAPESLPVAFSIVRLDGEPHEVVRTAAHGARARSVRRPLPPRGDASARPTSRPRPRSRSSAGQSQKVALKLRPATSP